MYLRIQERQGKGGQLTVREVAAYLAHICLLGGFSVYALAALVGGLIVEFPAPAPEQGVNRVERWAIGERRVAKVMPGVGSWLARSETLKPTIPLTAILESEGATVASASDFSSSVSTPNTLVTEPDATYRTVCVRLCDGAYFPLSFATTADHFGEDEQMCQSRCGAPARLFVYKNPGESPDSMVDRAGRPYNDLTASFRFKVRYSARCTCKSQPWEQEAQDRHRLYALEDHGAPEGEPELAQIRTRLAAFKSAREAPTGPIPKPPVFAAIAPASANDVTSTAAAPVVADVASQRDAAPSAAIVSPIVPVIVDDAPEKTEAELLNKAKSKTARKAVKPAKTAAKRLVQAPQRAKKRQYAGTTVYFVPVRYIYVRRYAANAPGELVRRHLLGNY